MKRKTGKFLSVMLSLFMLMTFADIAPGITASAETAAYKLWVNGVQVTSDNLTVACGSGTAVYDPSSNTLTLNGAQITAGHEHDWTNFGILSQLDGLTVIIASDSSINVTGTYGAEGIGAHEIDDFTYMPVLHNMTVKGSGTLTSNSGIVANGNLNVKGAKLNVGKLEGDENLTITDSNVTINSGSYGMVCVNGTLTVTNSVINITSKASCIELGNDYDTTLSPSMIINSGNLTLNSLGTATSYFGAMPGHGIESTAAGASLTINGGKLDITTTSGNMGTNIPVSNINLGKGINISSGDSLQSGGHIVVENTYTVTYDANGADSGTAPSDSTNYSSGAAVTVSGNTGVLAKAGYLFDGWNTASNGSGTTYAAGDTFSISANTTLFAKWTAHTHTFAPAAAADQNDGTHNKTCLTCGTAVNEAHSFTSFAYADDEYHQRMCPDCGATDGINAAHRIIWKSDSEVHWQQCGDCPHSLALTTSGEHTEDGGKITKAPTATSTGVKTYSCSVCGRAMRTEIIPATGVTGGTGSTGGTGGSSGGSYSGGSSGGPSGSGSSGGSAVTAVNPAPSSAASKLKAVTKSIGGGKTVISWNKITSASKYIIYKETDGKLVKLGETKTLSYTVSSKKTATYVIKYIKNGRECSDKNAVRITVKGTKPEVKAAASKNSVKLSWGAVPDAEKYAVYKYVNGKTKKLTETTKRSVTINKLRPDTEYSYIVRAYADGEWTAMTRSDIVTVRTKK